MMLEKVCLGVELQLASQPDGSQLQVLTKKVVLGHSLLRGTVGRICHPTGKSAVFPVCGKGYYQETPWNDSAL